MFKVENADFIADKLASELLPYQEYREAAKNSLEAIARRLQSRPAPAGRIEFDVDWHLYEASGEWLLACADNGDGMTRSELERYTTTLAVRGANQNQTIHGNQGMGLKISGPTRHKRGILIRSLKDGQRSMVQIGWDDRAREYNLLPVGPRGELIANALQDAFPSFINETGSGTVVTFLGNQGDTNTFAPADRPRGWLFKYLHQRFYRLSEREGEVFVRVPTGEPNDWPRSASAAAERQRGQGGRSFNLSRVRGTASIWDDAADRQGNDFRGVVDVPGDPAASVPAARIHWWVLPDGPGTDVSSRTASGGSLAVLYQNELHDWRTSSQASPYFARMGVLFGKSRVCLVIEPLGATVTSDFARAHVLVGSVPVLESDASLIWSEQFRTAMPERIRRTIAEEQARLQAEDPDRAKRIRDRLKDVLRLLRPRYFRKDDQGRVRAGGPEVAGPGDLPGEGTEIRRGPGHHRPGTSHRGLGTVLAQIDDEGGELATELVGGIELEINWVTEEQAAKVPIVSGDDKALNDRAAGLVGEDGASAHILLLNREFRGYRTLLAALNDSLNPEGDDAKAALIESHAQEWIEQKMIEAIQGLRQLANGSTWLPSSYTDALSPVALTAVFMADRYHTLREVRRQLGSLAVRTPREA